MQGGYSRRNRSDPRHPPDAGLFEKTFTDDHYYFWCLSGLKMLSDVVPKDEAVVVDRGWVTLNIVDDPLNVTSCVKVGIVINFAIGSRDADFVCDIAGAMFRNRCAYDRLCVICNAALLIIISSVIDATPSPCKLSLLCENVLAMIIRVNEPCATPCIDPPTAYHGVRYYLQ